MEKKKMDRRLKQLLKGMLFCTLAVIIISNPQLVAYAAPEDPVAVKFKSLQNLVANIVSSIGMIVTLWGISEFGLALQGNDGMMQSHSFKRIGGGLVMILAPQILTILTT